MNLVKGRSRSDISAPFLNTPSLHPPVLCHTGIAFHPLKHILNLSGLKRLPEPIPVAVDKRGNSPPTVHVDINRNLRVKDTCDLPPPHPPCTPPSLPVTHTSPLRLIFTYGDKHPAIDLQIFLGTCGKKKMKRCLFGMRILPRRGFFLQSNLLLNLNMNGH